jgi:hypothetical protein
MTENEFQQKHSELNTQIASALLSVIPDHWYSIQLDVSKNLIEIENDYGYSISNPDGGNEIVKIPKIIFSLYKDLLNLFHNHKEKWIESKFTIKWSEQTENWKYETDYKYS